MDLDLQPHDSLNNCGDLLIDCRKKAHNIESGQPGDSTYDYNVL